MEHPEVRELRRGRRGLHSRRAPLELDLVHDVLEAAVGKKDGPRKAHREDLEGHALAIVGPAKATRLALGRCRVPQLGGGDALEDEEGPERGR
eukprot:5790931-Pyramimonas_sp.AAC.2